MDAPTVSKIALTIEYDGTSYHGFQWQPGVPTIQGALEAAIRRLTGERRRVVAASRTDTGVHARGQVVTFRTGEGIAAARLVSGLNHFLPADIAVKTAARVPESWNVQRDAESREYRYRILNRRTRSPLAGRYSYLVQGELDTGAMNRACREMLGEQDLASLASDLKPEEAEDTVRRILSARIVREGELVLFDIAASGFLRHQVRNTVGALLGIGRGRVTVAGFREMLRARQVGLIGPAAPAKGLCLMKVNYPGRILGEQQNEDL